jgi:alpha-galactosidase/6-phospho-beta-glucosidase family protein
MALAGSWENWRSPAGEFLSCRRIAGFKLRLHDIDDSRLSEIRSRSGVDVEGERGDFAAVELATTDLKSAVNGADVIIHRRW